MFTTADDLYLSFRDGIRRTKQTTVAKSVFKRIWNEWALNQWIKDNLSFVEGASLTQKQEDDLESLRVVTDGVYEYGGSTLYPIVCDTNKPSIFSRPAVGLSINNDQGSQQVYPSYRRSYKLWFKVNNAWVKSTLLKVIDENFIVNSRFSAPSETLLYHKFRNNKIELIGDVVASSLKLDYVREPNYMSVSGDTLSYTIDLGTDQLEEIRNHAVRLYLERVQDPRWQSYLQEDLQKKISQK